MVKLRHLLDISNLSDGDIESIVDLSIRHMNGLDASDVLKGKIIANVFLENSTRTLLSFEIAEKSLGATAVTLNVSTSSINKGESIWDTLNTLDAMGTDLVVVRSGSSGFVHEMAKNSGICRIINAGNGSYEHPTQAITDYVTISYLKGRDIKGLNVTICGDVAHSRVARSNIRLLSRLGARVGIVTPPCFFAHSLSREVSFVSHKLEEGIRDADVIMLLRVQKERMATNAFISMKEYSKYYILDEDRLSALSKKDVIIMHPGPINRGVEISSKVADEHSSILLQVKVGVAVRKAILHYMLG